MRQCIFMCKGIFGEGLLHTNAVYEVFFFFEGVGNDKGIKFHICVDMEQRMSKGGQNSYQLCYAGEVLYKY